MARVGAQLWGRQRELGELRAALRRAEEGAGALVLLVGEPGIGKTRLAEELASEASGVFRVGWGRAWEAGGAPAYWPWVEVLRPWGSALAACSEAEWRRIAPLARLLPEMVPPALSPSGMEAIERGLQVTEPAQERFRLFDAAACFLALAARERPLLIILDDLHAADVASLALLHFVARNLRSARVMLVGTYRDVEARLSPSAGDVLAKVAREATYLALGRLGRDEVASWAAAEGVTATDDLFATTEGNPLFVGEVLRLARGTGVRPQLPDGVRAVIRARLATLSPAAHDFLAVASVLGRAVDLDLAAELAGVPLAAARDLAVEAVRSDVLTATGERPSFSHISIREVLYHELPAGRRAELHAQLGRTLVARDGADPDAPLTEAVHHLFAAAPTAGAGEAIQWARRGAERAMRRLAFDEAAQLLARATDALPPGRRDAERCDLLLDLAHAQIGAGELGRGRETALAAAAIARDAGDTTRLARAALRYGGVFQIAFVDRVLLGLLEEALAALPADDSPLRAQLLARLAAALQPAPDPAHPIALAHEAIEMARRVAEDPTRLEVLVAGTSALAYFAEPGDRLPLDTELVALATRRGDRVSVLRGLMRLVFDRLELGDEAGADATIEEYDRLSRAVDLPAFRWRAPLMRAMRALMQDRFDESEALCVEAAAIAARVEDAAAPLSLAVHTAGRLWAAGRLDALDAHLPAALEALARAADPIYSRTFRAGMLARIGRPEQAREDLDFVVRHDPPLRGRPMLVWAADVCLALGDRRAAATLAEVLAPMAGRGFFWSPIAMVMERRRIAEWVDELRRLAVPRATAPPVAAPAPRLTMTKEGDVWTIAADTTFRLRDSRGLQVLARLVAEPGREHHAADLLAPAGESGHVEDAGDVLDARAIAAYKRRLEDLRETEAEATRYHDPARATRAREEIEALASELSRGVGLGGRGRKASSTAEKARVNVRQRLHDAMKRIAEHSPALAKHLRQAIRTGVFCSYDP